jgi:hypothetical protein
MAFFQRYLLDLWNTDHLLLAVFLGAAIWVRIANLGEQSLWLDETVHIIQAKNFIQNGALDTGGDRNGILFSVLLVPIFKTLGYAVENARMISVLFGLGSLVLIYRIANRLFSPPVGLIAFMLATFSPYLIFWSKMARNYAIFTFFCLLFILQILDLTSRKEKGSFSFGKMSLLILTVIAGFLSHYLMILFVACGAVWLFALNGNEISIWIKSNLRITALSVLAVAMLGVVAFSFLAVNKELLAWTLPNWSHLRALYGEAPWYSLSVYVDVLIHDWKFLWVFAVIGLLHLAFKKQVRVTAFFLCCFVLPFLLLSFVFREPTAARYLIFIYPFFLVIAAFGLSQVGIYLQQKVNKVFKPLDLTLAISTLLLLPLFPLKNLKSVVEFSFSESNKPDARIIECVFSDWKQACDYLKSRLQQNDVVMATLPQIASVYFEGEDVLSFRQLYLDHKQKKYVPYAPANPAKNSAQTMQDLLRTVKTNKRGWLMADFYLEAVMTDPAARRFVFQNFHFYPEATTDGSVMLFGWDNEKPVPQNQNMILQVGRNDKVSSRELTFQLPKELMSKAVVQMRYRTQFVESEAEATIEVNGIRVSMPVSSKQNELQLLEIPTRTLRPGQNVFKFLYDGAAQSEKFKGYVVCYLEFVP